MKVTWELKPLPIPTQIWTKTSMNFIMGLPKAGNKSVVMVVVEHLSKDAHFLPQLIISLLPQWSRPLWIKYLCYMACLLPLSQMRTPHSPTNFGRNYLNFKVHN
jgi:hypothetical protein